MIKILMAGKNSYIGKNIKRHFVNNCKGYLMNAISMRTNSWESVNLEIYDYIIFLVGAKPEHPEGDSEILNYALNSHMPFDLAKAAKAAHVPRFIFLSTIDVYGKHPSLGEKITIDKNTQPEPDTLYGKSKLDGEMRIKTLEDDNFHPTILRLPLVYGLGCPGICEELRNRILEREKFPVIKNELSAINISTLCSFLQYLIENDYTGTFHPQNRSYISTNELLKYISDQYLSPLNLSKMLGMKYKLFKNSCPQDMSRFFGSFTYTKDIDL